MKIRNTLFAVCPRMLMCIAASFLSACSFAQGSGLKPKEIHFESAISMPLNADDRLAILDLLSGYSVAWDSRNIEGCLNLFAPEFVWEAYTAG